MVESCMIWRDLYQLRMFLWLFFYSSLQLLVVFTMLMKESLSIRYSSLFYETTAEEVYADDLARTASSSPSRNPLPTMPTTCYLYSASPFLVVNFCLPADGSSSSSWTSWPSYCAHCRLLTLMHTLTSPDFTKNMSLFYWPSLNKTLFFIWVCGNKF